jgi:hypothetical protein
MPHDTDHTIRSLRNLTRFAPQNSDFTEHPTAAANFRSIDSLGSFVMLRNCHADLQADSSGYPIRPRPLYELLICSQLSLASLAGLIGPAGRIR